MGGLGETAARRSGLRGGACNTPLFIIWTNTLAAPQPLAEAEEADRRPTRTDNPSTNLNETRNVHAFYTAFACARGL